jgi:hypothetical protein
VPVEAHMSGYWFKSHDVYDDASLTEPFSCSFRLLSSTELREQLQFRNTSNLRDLALLNPHQLPQWELGAIYGRHPEIVAEVVYNDWD